MLSRIGIKTFTLHHRFAAWTQSIGSGSGERMKKKMNSMWMLNCPFYRYSNPFAILQMMSTIHERAKWIIIKKKTNVNVKKRRSSHNKINGVIIISFSYAFANKTVRSTKLALGFERGHLATHERIFLYFSFFLWFELTCEEFNKYASIPT